MIVRRDDSTSPDLLPRSRYHNLMPNLCIHSYFYSYVELYYVLVREPNHCMFRCYLPSYFLVSLYHLQNDSSLETTIACMSERTTVKPDIRLLLGWTEENGLIHEGTIRAQVCIEACTPLFVSSANY